MAIPSPCYGCTARHEGCHITCKEGKEYEAKLEAMHEKRDEYNRSRPSHLSARKTRYR